MADKSNEHVVAMENGGAAIRVRTVKRKPIEERWSGEAITKITATPRSPNPKDTKQEEPLPERLTVGANPVGGDGTGIPEANTEEHELKLRDFKITKRLVERLGSTHDCKGCEGQLIGTRRAHSSACRKRMEELMKADENLAERIKERDRRTHRENEEHEADVDELMAEEEGEDIFAEAEEVKEPKKGKSKAAGEGEGGAPDQKRRKTEAPSSIIVASTF